MNIAVELAHQRIKWRFILPSAPHQSGICERLVLSFKRILYTILGSRRLTDKVLKTTFSLVDYALNSRPLTPISADSSDLGAITPNHFLIGNRATAIPSTVGVDKFDHRKRYTRAQSYANTIWSRRIKAYVPALNRRSKLQTPAVHHLKISDWVSLFDETNPRDYYTTALITELQYGSDSVARSAVLRTSFLITRLPACKIDTHPANIFFWVGGCYRGNKSKRENINQSDSSIQNTHRIASNLRIRLAKSSYYLILSKYNHVMYRLWWFLAESF